MFTANLDFVLLFVDNPLRSSSFYREILEMNPVEESATFVMFTFKNGIKLGLWSKHTAEPSVKFLPGAGEICFPTTDVDVLYKSWEKKQVTVAQKPIDMDFGRTFVILDPDGHRIRVYQLFAGREND